MGRGYPLHRLLQSRDCKAVLVLTPQTVSFPRSSQNLNIIFRTPPYFSEPQGIYQDNVQEEY